MIAVERHRGTNSLDGRSDGEKTSQFAATNMRATNVGFPHLPSKALEFRSVPFSSPGPPSHLRIVSILSIALFSNVSISKKEHHLG